MNQHVVDLFKTYFDKGYITHRDGNFCEKLNKDTYIVTRSGARKDNLKIHDFIQVDVNGKAVATVPTIAKPSIETLAHISALKYTNKKVSIHVHSPSTTALFSKYSDEYLMELESEVCFEWPELFRYTKLGQTVPFLDPGSEELHDLISRSFMNDPNTDIIVLQNHGVFAVGNTPDEAHEHIVRLEHISNILLEMGR